MNTSQINIFIENSPPTATLVGPGAGCTLTFFAHVRLKRRKNDRLPLHEGGAQETTKCFKPDLK